ncbi:uncharacterized protein LOC114387191 [Glycine soja]|nr:uncharacterized protein LOC102663723 [Glycine max]XP_006597535.1 uncharacterized protein LOC102663723 [Glycine max]XP_014623722.1 uncharacterized protein LOC102663723 [Glycine max]XP_028203136.1 uncharacterized protein LOC114387191 [Glycine soja]XP_028203137.1 uncharacterized protein LOC114387191 [Glycine soja]XP_028203138.1 uncharacterized protein LOC114387191 [Glycine soja]KHN33130.1 hypothetical protein glysoja_010121 [Glycine soja]|eukprot:XP_006597534.1 uncharacterized protein LOC102663723 [Glycine max]
MAEFEERLFAKVDSEVDIIYNKANEGESDNDEDDVAEGEDTEGDAARNDCDLWVAKWMKDCKWGQDYRIEVGEQDRMKFTLYLVLDSHNIIKEKIIQHATANRKHLEDKQRRIVVPN